MPVPIPPQDAQRALNALGVTQSALDLISKAPFAQAQVLLKNLKFKAHRRYKQLALELHPDRTKGDKSKADFFVLLGLVLEDLDKMTIQPPTMPVAVRVPIVFWQHFDPVSSITTTTRSTNTSVFTVTQIRRVVKMHPK